MYIPSIRMTRIVIAKAFQLFPVDQERYELWAELVRLAGGPLDHSNLALELADEKVVEFITMAVSSYMRRPNGRHIRPLYARHFVSWCLGYSSDEDLSVNAFARDRDWIGVLGDEAFQDFLDEIAVAIFPHSLLPSTH